MSPEEKSSYLQKRDTIIEILESLQGSWDLAEGLSALIGSSHVTPEMIDNVEKLLTEALDQVKDISSRQKIQSGLDKLAELKKKEEGEKVNERTEVEQNILANFNF